MTTIGLYEVVTSEGDDGTMHPAEQVWTLCADGAADHGFIAHQSLFVAGIDGGSDDYLYPVGFPLLGHHRWADIIEAAVAYIGRIYGWRNLRLYLGDDSSALILRIPCAVLTRGDFLRHPYPDHPCGCEWEGTRRLVWAPPTDPGAIPISAIATPPPWRPPPASPRPTTRRPSRPRRPDT
ncbi:hypothetical protein [Streptomyces naphthomycinicus]|uniref:hypothetical protein n=1 Tax=Streptomyces naphthomycinicus TaxID=2872625 RepID=UPI001CEDB2D3|nr:hypothetical protein [Streptomyces sp. TML10]